MPIKYNVQQFAAKEESEEGTAETLAAADAILAGDVAFEPEISMTDVPAASASLSPFPKVAGSRQAKVSCSVALKGSGSAGTAPEYGPLLKACGMGETVVSETSVTYKPASASIVSVTIGWFVDGKKYVMAGCRGTYKLDLKAGGPGVLKFEFTGTAIADSDTALLASPTYDATTPPPFMSASFTLASYAAVIDNLSIDIGNTLKLRPSANAAMGFVSAVITGREPKLTLDPEDVLVATKDWWALWEAGTLSALTATVGATAGNICTITAPKAQILGMKPTNSDGVVIQETECLLARNTGDDEFVLALT